MKPKKLQFLTLFLVCALTISAPMKTYATQNDTYTGDESYNASDDIYSDDSGTEINDDSKDNIKDTPDKNHASNAAQYLSWSDAVIVEKVNTEIVVDTDNTYRVTKNIRVFYNTDKNHELILSVSLANLNSSASDIVKDINVVSHIEGTSFKTKSTTNAYEIIITDPVKGRMHTDYTVEYIYESKGDTDTSADFFVQNLAGFKNAPVCSVNFKVVMPYEYQQKDLYFQDSKGEKLLIVSSKDFVTITGSYSNVISENLNMTLVVEDDYFTKSKNKLSFSLILGLVNILCIGMIGCGFALAGISYYQFGKNATPEITLNKDIIKELSPVDMIISLTGGVTNESLLLYILYLANEGYLTIEDNSYKTQKNRNPATSYQFVKIKEYHGDNHNIRTIMQILFSDNKVVSPIQLSHKAYKRFDKLRLRIQEVGIKDVWEIDESRRKLCANIGVMIPLLASLLLSLHNLNSGSIVHAFSFIYGPIMAVSIYMVIKKADGFIKKRNVMRGGVADTMTWTYVFIVAFLLLILVQTFNSGLFVKNHTLLTIAYLSEIILIYCSCNMRKRTEKGTEMCGQIIGFRQYLLELNEIDMKKNVLKDEQYIYRILPYAMALELATEGWCAQMDGCYIDNPKWYSSASESEFKLAAFMKDWKIISDTILEMPPKRNDGND